MLQTPALTISTETSTPQTLDTSLDVTNPNETMIPNEAGSQQEETGAERGVGAERGAEATTTAVHAINTTGNEDDDNNDKKNFPNDFINHGLQRWEQTRNEWLAHNHGSSDGTSSSHSNNTPKPVAIPLDVDAIIDVIFSPRGRGASGAGNTNVTTAAADGSTSTTIVVVETDCAAPEDDNNTNSMDPSMMTPEVPPRRFPINVPLPQMVDILVDLWEAEGLDT